LFANCYTSYLYLLLLRGGKGKERWERRRKEERGEERKGGEGKEGEAFPQIKTYHYTTANSEI